MTIFIVARVQNWWASKSLLLLKAHQMQSSIPLKAKTSDITETYTCLPRGTPCTMRKAHLNYIPVLNLFFQLLGKMIIGIQAFFALPHPNVKSWHNYIEF